MIKNRTRPGVAAVHIPVPAVVVTGGDYYSDDAQTEQYSSDDAEATTYKSKD